MTTVEFTRPPARPSRPPEQYLVGRTTRAQPRGREFGGRSHSAEGLRGAAPQEEEALLRCQAPQKENHLLRLKEPPEINRRRHM